MEHLNESRLTNFAIELVCVKMSAGTSMKRDIVEEIHRNARKHFPRRHVIMKGIDETWEIDLVDLQAHKSANSNYKYILTVIDTFSKFAYAKALKDKSGGTVAKAMEEIFISSKKSPQKIHSDAGKEFFCKPFQALMAKYKILHYQTYSHIKVKIVSIDIFAKKIFYIIVYFVFCF